MVACNYIVVLDSWLGWGNMDAVAEDTVAGDTVAGDNAQAMCVALVGNGSEQYAGFAVEPVQAWN